MNYISTDSENSTTSNSDSIQNVSIQKTTFSSATPTFKQIESFYLTQSVYESAQLLENELPTINNHDRKTEKLSSSIIHSQNPHNQRGSSSNITNEYSDPISLSPIDNKKADVTYQISRSLIDPRLDVIYNTDKKEWLKIAVDGHSPVISRQGSSNVESKNTILKSQTVSNKSTTVWHFGEKSEQNIDSKETDFTPLLNGFQQAQSKTQTLQSFDHKRETISPLRGASQLNSLVSSISLSQYKSAAVESRKLTKIERFVAQKHIEQLQTLYAQYYQRTQLQNLSIDSQSTIKLSDIRDNHYLKPVLNQVISQMPEITRKLLQKRVRKMELKNARLMRRQQINQSQSQFDQQSFRILPLNSSCSSGNINTNPNNPDEDYIIENDLWTNANSNLNTDSRQPQSQLFERFAKFSSRSLEQLDPNHSNSSLPLQTSNQSFQCGQSHSDLIKIVFSCFGYQIFRYLDMSDLLFCASPVNHLFNNLSCDMSLWKNLLNDRYGSRLSLQNQLQSASRDGPNPQYEKEFFKEIRKFFYYVTAIERH